MTVDTNALRKTIDRLSRELKTVEAECESMLSYNDLTIAKLRAELARVTESVSRCWLCRRDLSNDYALGCHECLPSIDFSAFTETKVPG